ncbi:p300_1L [African swine fever virus]|uniref:p300_1L n=1 Tax=African swine fever virus TaxID=10497 RepID=A0A8A1V2U8_ASF|nr:p300_1L [African swine fever virus]
MPKVILRKGIHMFNIRPTMQVSISSLYRNISIFAFRYLIICAIICFHISFIIKHISCYIRKRFYSWIYFYHFPASRVSLVLYGQKYAIQRTKRVFFGIQDFAGLLYGYIADIIRYDITAHLFTQIGCKIRGKIQQIQGYYYLLIILLIRHRQTLYDFTTGHVSHMLYIYSLFFFCVTTKEPRIFRCSSPGYQRPCHGYIFFVDVFHQKYVFIFALFTMRICILVAVALCTLLYCFAIPAYPYMVYKDCIFHMCMLFIDVFATTRRYGH